MAGGLSAGLVLVWWPVIFSQSASIGSWVWRGLAWTLVFELLLGLLVPLQSKMSKHPLAIRAKVSLQAKINHGKNYLPEHPVTSTLLLAAVALALPAGLIISGPAPVKQTKRPLQIIKKQTKIIKPVKVVRITKIITKKEIKIVKVPLFPGPLDPAFLEDPK